MSSLNDIDIDLLIIVSDLLCNNDYIALCHTCKHTLQLKCICKKCQNNRIKAIKKLD